MACVGEHVGNHVLHMACVGEHVGNHVLHMWHVLVSMIVVQVDRSVDTLYPKGVLESKEERDGMHSSVAAFSKKSKKGAVSNRKKAKGQDKIRRRTANLKKAKKVSSTREESASEKEDEMDDRSKSVTKKQTKTRRGRKDQRGSGSSVDEDEDGEQDDGEKEMDEEEEWKKLQQSMQKLSKKKFEHHSTDSHTVHAPYFPEVRQPYKLKCFSLFGKRRGRFKNAIKIKILLLFIIIILLN